jgi:hypothetical protein
MYTGNKTVCVWLSEISISTVIGLMILAPVRAHDSPHSGKPNLTPDEKLIAVCHLDVDGEFDLINMSLQLVFEHLENNDGHMLAVDGRCVAPR